MVFPKKEAPGQFAAVSATDAPPAVPADQCRECIGVDRRRTGDIEDRDAVRRAASRSVPGSAAGSRTVPADPTPDRLNGVAARVRVHRTDQEESVRVAAHSAVAVRRPAVAARSSVAADGAVDRVRGQPSTARRTHHFDSDGRPGVAASAPGGAPGTAPGAPLNPRTPWIVFPSIEALAPAVTRMPIAKPLLTFVIVLPETVGKLGCSIWIPTAVPLIELYAICTSEVLAYTPTFVAR